MKFCVIVCCLFVLSITVFAAEEFNSTTAKPINTKVAEKVFYPKKVSSIKKNPSRTSLKKIADITEKFKDLPADDLAFIKELDKQFKLHGGKVKIKVENKNVTADKKNSKRTIDGELGYGYAHNGYQYNPPKFMFYPYSQQNIANKAPNYFLTGDGKTEVSIEPSYSYELKSQSYITHNEPQIDVPKPELPQQTDNFKTQQHHDQQQQQYEEPVIVLRIPGPAKYATHLQMLLQRYLEIRAAQYLHILEEADYRNNQQQHQLQQLEYGHGNNAIAEGHIEQPHVPITEQHDYKQQVQYDHQIAVTPQPIQYSDIDNVYRNYKHRHSSQSEQIQQPLQDTQIYYTPHQSGEEQQSLQYQHQTHYKQHEQQYQQQEHHQPQYQQQVQEQPQFYYTHEQQYAQNEGPPANTYQHIYLLSMIHQGQANYEGPQDQPEKQPIYAQDQSNHNEHASSLPIAENSPRPSHTKVVFTNKNEVTTQDYQMYQLPSIKPNERHAPTSIPDYHQDFQQEQQYQNVQGKQDSQDSSINYQQHYNAAKQAKPKVLSITQRPFNYHAHSVKARARGRTAHTRRAATAKEADNGLQKIREFVREKLGAEMGSAVEFKTTQVIVA